MSSDCGLCGRWVLMRDDIVQFHSNSLINEVKNAWLVFVYKE